MMENVEEVKRKGKGKESRFGKRYGLELKLRCVKLRLEEGLPVSLLSKEAGVSKDVVYRWVKAYQERGEAGLRNQVRSSESRRKLPGPVRGLQNGGAWPGPANGADPFGAAHRPIVRAKRISESEMHNNPEILSKLLAAIGRKVAFQYPGGEGEKRGILKDRAIIPSNPGEAGVPYWDVVDLITFQNEPQPEWIRIGYYRRPKDRLIWGSQTTITEPVGVWRRILTEAARQKPWFRKLLLEVVDAIRGENAQQ